MNVIDYLLSGGEPSAVAVCDGPSELTYGDLRDVVDGAARYLMSRGCRKQDRVAIWSENSVFFVISYLAAIRAGLVVVPLQSDSSPDLAAQIVRDADAKTLLVSTRYRAQASTWAAQAGAAILGEPEVVETRLDERGVGPFPSIDPDRDLAALMFTSGSTGAPKGVMVTHRNIACNTADIVHYLGLSSDDRGMVVLPFYYCFGLSLLHTHLAVGGSVVINNQFMYPERVLTEMEERGCTGLAGVASTYQILLRKSRFKQTAFSRLRWLQQAGGKLANAYITEIVEAFPNVRFYVMYGQTEATARLSYLPPDRLQDKLGSIGKGLGSTRLEVVRPDGTPVAQGAGEIGEIVASGDNITLGYWRDPHETAAYFRNGRLHTGDIARVDHDDFIFIVDRERDLIKVGGNRVGAREIEDVIAELGEVVEVAVVAAPHGVLGEAPVAFVVTVDPRDRDVRVLAHCRRRLPAFKVPTLVIYLPDLPHSGSGKVLKACLKPLAAEALEGKGAETSLTALDGTPLRPLRVEHRGERATPQTRSASFAIRR